MSSTIAISAEKIEQLRQAIRRAPDDPELHYDLGGLLLNCGKLQEAVSSYQTALKLAPGHPQILLQLGNAMSQQGRYQQAVDYFQQSLRADASDAAAHYNLGNALRELGKAAQAEQSYRTALRFAPQDADTYNNLGNVLREQGKLDEAVTCYEQALRINSKLHHARAHLLHQRQHMCDWTNFDTEVAEIRRIVREEPQAQISPFAFISLPGTTPQEQMLCASQWVSNRYGALLQDHGKTFAHIPQGKNTAGKLRIGYLSGDIRLHPVPFLAVELFELHDRTAFEIHGYSYGPPDDSTIRQRTMAAFDYFTDIRNLSHEEAARKIHSDGIDILVDLTGFTQSSRSGLMALRPAPVQVNFLGYPGTMGASFVDYIIGDPTITPMSNSAAYTEKLVVMPEVYQPNDRKRQIAPLMTREECGLPDTGFVFCSFNQTFKITPQLFEIYIELLGENPNSVLWLLDCNRWAKDNLRSAAKARGIAPDRLIFAPRMPVEQHLARHACADLFLDTLPYNAHTTASDALWAGLPLVTCIGDTFAARVAASLLHAVGLPELVTTNLADFKALALHLASHPDALQAIRSRLAENRTSAPLFNSVRFTHHLESAYRTMWQQYLTGKIESFSVAAQPRT